MSGYDTHRHAHWIAQDGGTDTYKGNSSTVNDN
jgi:hypothetical protein